MQTDASTTTNATSPWRTLMEDPVEVLGPDLPHSWDIEGLHYGVSTVSFSLCFHWRELR